MAQIIWSLAKVLLFDLPLSPAEDLPSLTPSSSPGAYNKIHTFLLPNRLSFWQTQASLIDHYSTTKLVECHVKRDVHHTMKLVVRLHVPMEFRGLHLLGSAGQKHILWFLSMKKNGIKVYLAMLRISQLLYPA
eukprot:scaffold276935_cov39-Prasinocladus_malaysianus.AAC.2